VVTHIASVVVYAANPSRFDAKRSEHHAPATNDATNALCVRQAARATELRLTRGRLHSSLNAARRNKRFRLPSSLDSLLQLMDERSSANF